MIIKVKRTEYNIFAKRANDSFLRRTPIGSSKTYHYFKITDKYPLSSLPLLKATHCPRPPKNLSMGMIKCLSTSETN